MSDKDAETLANWVAKAIIYAIVFLLFGVLILAFWLLQRYPKVMLPIIGILVVGSVAYYIFSTNSAYSYQSAYRANTASIATPTSKVNRTLVQSEQTQTSSVTTRGATVGPKQLYIGALTSVTAIELNIRPNPSTDGTPLGKVKQGARLEIVSGPVWVPTTSDDGQPMERDWWQVTGWDTNGNLGWCSSRYLEVVP